ncbi:hypothetical protein FB451DRAFT_1176670 [Mycena latifolia]|nr:hypothetical protein FB451DRAFT_1176670 [Mycena latifolia]
MDGDGLSVHQNGVRSSDGVMTMTNGQQYTAIPPEGFWPVQCVESPWRNTSDRNRAVWSAVEGPKGWVRVFRAKYLPNARDIVAKLNFAIPRLVDAPKVVISPPTAREELDERLAAPWNFLISDIPQASLNRLTSQYLWSTPTITFMVFPFDMPLPNYILTLQNFSLPDSNESNVVVANTVKAKVKAIKEATDYLVKRITAADPAAAAAEMIDSIEVKSLELALPGHNAGTDVVWNVYCKPHSSLTFDDFISWCGAFRSLTFETDRYGTGVPRIGKDQLFCVGCKSYDHPTGLCPLPRTIGWFGPSVRTMTSEDKTLQTSDERTQKSMGSTRNGGKSDSGKRRFGNGNGKGGNRNTRGPVNRRS